VVAVAALEIEVDAEWRQQEIMALLKNEDCSSEYSSSVRRVLLLDPAINSHLCVAFRDFSLRW
jgi:hypothetical protein